MCNYLHLQASSVQITSTFCFEVPLGAAMLVHFLPLKGWAKGLDTFCQWMSESPGTLYFCQWRAESPKTPYTFATHSGCVNTHFDASDTSDSDTHSWVQNGSTPIWPHSCFHNYQTSAFKKKDEKQSWPSHNSFCATGRLEWKKFENVPLVFSCCFPSDLKGKNPRVPMSNNYWGEMFKTAPWSTALWLCAVVYSWYCCLFDSSLCFLSLSVSGSASMHHTPQLLGCTDSTEKRTCVLISWK